MAEKYTKNGIPYHILSVTKKNGNKTETKYAVVTHNFMSYVEEVDNPDNIEIEAKNENKKVLDQRQKQIVRLALERIFNKTAGFEASFKVSMVDDFTPKYIKIAIEHLAANFINTELAKNKINSEIEEYKNLILDYVFELFETSIIAHLQKINSEINSENITEIKEIIQSFKEILIQDLDFTAKIKILEYLFSVFSPYIQYIFGDGSYKYITKINQTKEEPVLTII